MLLHNGGLIKSVQFKKYQYVGDPINAVKIFNEKEIDEIVVIDIDATREGRAPAMDAVREIASEAFIPLGYGGGISTLEEIKQLFYLGVEKVILNYQAFTNPGLVTEASKMVGSQSVVVSIDVKKNFLGKYKVYIKNGTENTRIDPETFAIQMQKAGAGEIFLNSIDRDGMYQGYDLDLLKKVSRSLTIPLIICGGASSIEDFKDAIHQGASAVAAGSLFVFQRPHKAVLISYPSQNELKEKLYSVI